MNSAKDCPVCSRPAAGLYAPFCSKRCSDVDLGRWLNEDYAFPVSPEEDGGTPTGSAVGAPPGDAGDDESDGD